MIQSSLAICLAAIVTLVFAVVRRDDGDGDTAGITEEGVTVEQLLHSTTSTGRGLYINDTINKSRNCAYVVCTCPLD